MASFTTGDAGATTIIKSHNDKRLYRFLTLSNNLSVTLVSDAETEKASACMDVRVGSLMDPPEMPGLAHFLEHMVRHLEFASFRLFSNIPFTFDVRIALPRDGDVSGGECIQLVFECARRIF